MIELATVHLPRFGVEAHLPGLSVEEYRSRLEGMQTRMGEAALDVLVVYADREHAANLEFLTGFDPRFEEALFLLDRHGGRRLLVGNECLGYLPDERLGIGAELIQDLSLLGQPRESSRPLRRVLAEYGIGRGTRVGCAGWKYFGASLGEPSREALDVPAYLVDVLRDLTGDRALVTNATALFMHPATGARIVNSANQIARFEYAAIRTSEAIRTAVERIAPGVEEQTLERHFYPGGLPLSCHAMASFGAKARRGLSSPSGRAAQLGDAFTMAFGLTGALTCRAGTVASDAVDLPSDLRDFYPTFARNYFDVVATWYEHVRVGARGGDVFAAVDATRDPALFQFAVNPGHYIHLDEWVHSPFSRGSDIALPSGAAVQMDIIPVSCGPFCTINAEDGIALADEALRAECAARFPAMWSRISARRAFMMHTLGITLDQSVLPLSNTAGWLAPYALAPTRAFVKR
ncbi:MAG: hypothetical protein OEW19_02455 [Acidobacteriota bacterium]|nr:hypothetical protein [Acidobacteriota bacterium]